MSELQQNLKAIVGIDELKQEIEQIQNYLSIPGRIGIGTQSDVIGQDNGQTTASAGFGPGYGATATSGEGLLDGTAPMAPGQQLNGVDEIFDCDSGKEIEIREDGYAIPPIGWATADTPPAGSSGEGELPGFWFSGVSGADSFISNSYLDVIDWLIANTDVAEAFDSWGLSGPPNSADLPTPGSSETKNYPFNVTFNNGNPGTFQLSIVMQRCDRTTELPPEATAACSIEPAPVEEWPEDTKFQLIRGQDGVLRPHERDPNVPTAYQDGVTTLDFCFGDGRTGRRETTAGGGFMYYETDGEGSTGDPIGDAKVFAADGTMLRNDVPPDKIDLYRPKDL